MLVVPRNGGGVVYQGQAASLAAAGPHVLDLTIADLQELCRGDRAVLVRFDGDSKLAAEAVFIGLAGRTSRRFQMLGDWRVIERRIFPRFDTKLRATIFSDGAVPRDGKVLDMSEGGLRVLTSGPAAGAVEVLIHEGIEGVRLGCDVVGARREGHATELRLRYRELSVSDRRFVRRMVSALQALSEHGRDLLAS